MTTLSQILEHKIITIIRGAEPDDVLKIVNALYEGGVRVLEITLNSQDALAVIKKISVAMGKQILIGAGTVLDAKTAEAAISAGAQFIISPILNLETIQATKKHGTVSIPGAFTATEILTAYNNGGDIIKIFPASVGANYIRDLRGPFPQIPLMPTGGINLQNMREYLQAGAVAIGIGSALVDTSKKITGEYLEQLSVKALEFVQIASNF